MECPNCRRVNPPSSSVCDCGYDFENRAVRTPQKAGLPSAPSADDRLVKVFWRIAMGVAFLWIFVERGYMWVGGLLMLLVWAILGATAIALANWRSIGFMALAYGALEFTCTLGPGSNPCEPMNGTRLLLVIAAAVGLFVYDRWSERRSMSAAPKQGEP